MATFVGFDDLGRRLDMMARDLSAKGMESRLAKVGRDLAPLVDRAVQGEIGDQSMSGWSRKRQVEIVGTSSVRDGLLTVEPKGVAKGPMRVLESGRNAYAAGDRRTSGFYVSKKTGERRQKSRKVKRTTGATKGKGTWSDAAEAIAREAPGRINDQKVAAMARHFTRG